MTIRELSQLIGRSIERTDPLTGWIYSTEIIDVRNTNFGRVEVCLVEGKFFTLSGQEIEKLRASNATGATK